MSDFVIERVRAFTQSLLPAMNLELYDIQFRREGHGWVLRLIIDSAAGITLDNCSQVSRQVSDYLDVEDIISHAYNLEVSSPGAERTLRDISECERFVSEKVRLKMKEEVAGQRVFIGELSGVVDDTLNIVMEDGTEQRFSWEQIKKARLTL